MVDRLLDSNQVAEILGTNRDTALSLMRKMDHIDISTGPFRQNLRIRERTLENWLQSRTKLPVLPRKRGRKPKCLEVRKNA